MTRLDVILSLIVFYSILLHSTLGSPFLFGASSELTLEHNNSNYQHYNKRADGDDCMIWIQTELWSTCDVFTQQYRLNFTRLYQIIPSVEVHAKPLEEVSSTA